MNKLNKKYERPKCVKDDVKQAQKAQSRPEGPLPEGPLDFLFEIRRSILDLGSSDGNDDNDDDVPRLGDQGECPLS